MPWFWCGRLRESSREYSQARREVCLLLLACVSYELVYVLLTETLVKRLSPFYRWGSRVSEEGRPHWSRFGLVSNSQWAWLESIPLPVPISRIMKLRFSSENPETQFAENPAFPHFFLVTCLYLSRQIKAVQLCWSVIWPCFDLGLFLVLSNSEIWRHLLPHETVGPRRNTKQYTAVPRCRDLGNPCWASISVPCLPSCLSPSLDTYGGPSSNPYTLLGWQF